MHAQFALQMEKEDNADDTVKDHEFQELVKTLRKSKEAALAKREQIMHEKREAQKLERSKKEKKLIERRN